MQLSKIISCILLQLLAIGSAHSQNYPERPLRLIVPTRPAEQPTFWFDCFKSLRVNYSISQLSSKIARAAAR